MKYRNELIAAAALAFAVGAAQAHGTDKTYRSSTSYEGAITTTSPNAIHSGGLTAQDTALADEVAAALRADSRLKGATVTVSAKDGRVALSGSAATADQSEIAQRIAKNVAGARSVSGFLSPAAG